MRGESTERDSAWWPGAVAGLLVICLALAVWAALRLLSEPDRSLPLPAAGEVVPAYVDQRPVFVVHDADGAVRVLDATSPHDPFPKVLAWCQTSQLFEDLWHLSAFNRHGQWVGGPAPTGMAEYDLLAQHHDRVEVGQRQPAPVRLPHDERAGGRQGPWCAGRTALYLPGNPSDPSVLEDLVVHDPVPEDADPRLWFPTHERILGQAEARP